MRLRLITGKTGELVTFARIPNFNEPPKAVTWGTRVFVHHSGPEGEPEGEVVYSEVFHVAIVDEQPDPRQGDLLA